MTETLCVKTLVYNTYQDKKRQDLSSKIL